MLDGHSPWRLHFAQNAVLILISLLFLPLSTLILFVSYALKPLRSRNGLRRRPPRRNSKVGPRVVLVTGVGMTKGLALARAFYKAGHIVIGADFEPYGIPVCGRFSGALTRFYALSKPDARNGATLYIQDLLRIVKRHDVDLWVSCSGVASAVEDGRAKEVIERRTKCIGIQFDVKTTSTLHEKHSFIQHTLALGLPAPETHDVTSRTAVHQILNNADGKKKKKKYIMKSVGMEDAVRGDMTLLPRRTISDTYQHISTIRISKEKPYVLQQFIRGEEYCTHALVVRGQVKAFVACPSSELLMHYRALPADTALSKAMYIFTREFAARSGQDMTGHLSFDFLVDESVTEKGLEKVLYPIECNPRAHTAVALFNGQSEELAECYLTALAAEPALSNGQLINNNNNNDYDNQVLTPTNPAKYYWAGHDLIALLLLPTLHLLRRKISISELAQSWTTFLEHVLFWKDGTFEVWDPLPWWWLYHVYWPGQFLGCLLARRKWSRVNVSTGKMFGC